MSSELFERFSLRVERLLRQDSTWEPEAYSAIAVMMDEVVTIVKTAVEAGDTSQFLNSILTYLYLVKKAVNVLLERPNRGHADELYTEANVFVVEVVNDLFPELQGYDLEEYGADLILWMILDEVDVIRPPPP